VPVASVKKVTIWGNHSDTQYPDYKNAEIAGVPANSVISDPAWFSESFIPTVAKRGGAVIKARGASSAASAANAALGTVQALHVPTPAGDWFSAGVVSDGSYGIQPGLIYSYPLVSKGGCNWSIVQDVNIDDEARQRLDASAAELISERDAVKDLLGPAA
jgi:malate dehydrogenase